jgi:hypothetical protein
MERRAGWGNSHGFIPWLNFPRCSGTLASKASPRIADERVIEEVKVLSFSADKTFLVKRGISAGEKEAGMSSQVQGSETLGANGAIHAPI